MREELMAETTRTRAENRALLVAALRGEVASPRDFIWDYNYILRDARDLAESDERYSGRCGTVGCAIGLAVLLGIVSSSSSGILGEAIGIRDRCRARSIFSDAGFYGLGVWFADVTPRMVADAIEAVPASELFE